MLLRDLDQLSMDEVAVQLGLSIPAAKSLLARARMELRSRVMKHVARRGSAEEERRLITGAFKSVRDEFHEFLSKFGFPSPRASRKGTSLNAPELP
jgi:hypothetical protein